MRLFSADRAREAQPLQASFERFKLLPARRSASRPLAFSRLRLVRARLPQPRGICGHYFIEHFIARYAPHPPAPHHAQRVHRPRNTRHPRVQISKATTPPFARLECNIVRQYAGGTAAHDAVPLARPCSCNLTKAARPIVNLLWLGGKWRETDLNAWHLEVAIKCARPPLGMRRVSVLSLSLVSTPPRDAPLV